MAEPSDEVFDAIAEVLPPCLDTLERIAWVQRHLYPPVAVRLAEALGPQRAALEAPLAALERAACPPELAFMRDRLVTVARETAEIVGAFVEAAAAPDDRIGLYRALRRAARVLETLYPLAPALESVSRLFLEPDRRQDAELVSRLRAAALRDDDLRVGILHAQNERADRGGFSLYVPETTDGRTPMPLVVALHGGSGHGRDFLWSWVANARSRSMLVMAPTSRDRTWSIIGGDDVDAEPLAQMVASVAARYPVDRERVLLTGMSDGATYALLCGVQDDMPFTHLAPACGVLHPYLITGEGMGRMRDRPIYLVHGALDWMFPVHTARMAHQMLAAAGARIVYREIEDLSHTYPRDENPKILDWLIGPAA